VLFTDDTDDDDDDMLLVNSDGLVNGNDDGDADADADIDDDSCSGVLSLFNASTSVLSLLIIVTISLFWF
jgi:hypothetical protein